MMPGQKYYCRVCKTEKTLRIKPSTAEKSIKTGCEQCGRPTKHTKL